MEPGLSEPSPQDLMSGFAERTGLSSAAVPPRRYLWTDAFAVCNFLGLWQTTGDAACRDQALHLIEQVHRVLGRHRGDDSRRGWISGLDEEDGDRHPTEGGLRIGKPRPERQAGEPLDENLEWHRDGQYFHYLTKWMHALHQAGTSASEPVLLIWAIELARAAHAGFIYENRSSGPKRMYWKMRIDLSAPLVKAMGQHDPLDGLITFCQLQQAARRLELPAEFDLLREIEDLRTMCRGVDWTTEDPLGIGGLLFDACRVAQIPAGEELLPGNLLPELLDSALASLEICIRAAPWRLPAMYRLPFRELGLAIGLKALETIRKFPAKRAGNPGRYLSGSFDPFREYLPLAGKIERFWLVDANREYAGWEEHRDINEVMLATTLLPEGFLVI